MSTDQNAVSAEERVPVLYVKYIPKALMDQLTEEANKMQVSKMAYVRDVLCGMTPATRMLAWIEGKALAGDVKR